MVVSHHLYLEIVVRTDTHTHTMWSVATGVKYSTLNVSAEVIMINWETILMSFEVIRV